MGYRRGGLAASARVKRVEEQTQAGGPDGCPSLAPCSAPSLRKAATLPASLTMQGDDSIPMWALPKLLRPNEALLYATPPSSFRRCSQRCSVQLPPRRSTRPGQQPAGQQQGRGQHQRVG